MIPTIVFYVVYQLASMRDIEVEAYPNRTDACARFMEVTYADGGTATTWRLGASARSTDDAPTLELRAVDCLLSEDGE